MTTLISQPIDPVMVIIGGVADTDTEVPFIRIMHANGNLYIGSRESLEKLQAVLELFNVTSIVTLLLDNAAEMIFAAAALIKRSTGSNNQVPALPLGALVSILAVESRFT